MPIIVQMIDEVISNIDNEEAIAAVKTRVNEMMTERPMFAW